VERHFETGDIIVGVLGTIGVVVLIAVFVYVFRQVIKKEQ
jgi:hypothetical protein